MEEKRFVFKVNIKNLCFGLAAALMIAMGLFLFVSILSGRISFESSPYPRQDRGILVILSWILISLSFLVLAPNKNGLIPAIGVFVGLYLSFAYVTGSYLILDSSAFIDIAVGMKILIAPIFFIVVLCVLLYNAVSGQEFFKSVIFGAVSIGFLVLGAWVGIL